MESDETGPKRKYCFEILCIPLFVLYEPLFIGLTPDFLQQAKWCTEHAVLRAEVRENACIFTLFIPLKLLYSRLQPVRTGQVA